MSRVEIVARHLHRALCETLCIDVDADALVPATIRPLRKDAAPVEMVPAWTKFRKEAEEILADLGPSEVRNKSNKIRPIRRKPSWPRPTVQQLEGHH